MVKIIIDKQRCKGCGLCRIYCPKGLLMFDAGLNKKGYTSIAVKPDAQGQCVGCGICALMCPDCCIQIEKE